MCSTHLAQSRPWSSSASKNNFSSSAVHFLGALFNFFVVDVVAVVLDAAFPVLSLVALSLVVETAAAVDESEDCTDVDLAETLVLVDEVDEVFFDFFDFGADFVDFALDFLFFFFS